MRAFVCAGRVCLWSSVILGSMSRSFGFLRRVGYGVGYEV